MDIAPTTSSLSPTAGSRSATDSADGAITSDFDTFLRMLTAQITNQDPLNPINAEQFAVQLATFSGVEQQVRTNQLLEALTGAMGQSDFGKMAAWIGMEARAPMPALYSGTPLAVTVPEPIAGNRHDLVAVDAWGSEIWRGEYTHGAGSVSWDGIRPDGLAVPTGLYSFRLESFEDDRLVATEPAETYGRVAEVRLERGAPVLVFEGGVERAPGEVSALRRFAPAA